jgi:hypothetical protein
MHLGSWGSYVVKGLGRRSQSAAPAIPVRLLKIGGHGNYPLALVSPRGDPTHLIHRITINPPDSATKGGGGKPSHYRETNTCMPNNVGCMAALYQRNGVKCCMRRRPSKHIDTNLT